MSNTFDDIEANFEFLDTWEDRYRYVIDLGKVMPDLDPSMQIEATKVNGCASQVWIVPTIEGSGKDAVMTFAGTSDAMIVRGLIALLLALYNNKPAQEVRAIDAHEKLSNLGFDQHLSAQRSNGLRAMIERIRDLATRTIEAKA